MLAALQKWALESFKDKNAYLRALLLIWSYLVARHILTNLEPPAWLNPLWTVSHGIHEIGHWVAKPLGMWVSVAMGTIFEIAFPVFVIGAMIRGRDLHGASVLLTWLAITFLHSAHYAGSAAFSGLKLVTAHYITLYHDWVWMLSRLGILHHAEKVENFFYSLSVLSLFSSFGLQAVSLYFIWKVNREV